MRGVKMHVRQYHHPNSSEQAAIRAAEERRYTDSDLSASDVGMEIVRASDGVSLGQVVAVNGDNITTSLGVFRRAQLRVDMSGATAESLLVARVLAALGATLVRSTARQCEFDRGAGGRYAWGVNVDMPRGMLLRFAAQAAPP